MPGYDGSYSLKRNDLVVVGFDLDHRSNTHVLEGAKAQLTPKEKAGSLPKYGWWVLKR